MFTHEAILVIYEAGPEAVISVIQRLETIKKQAIQIAELEESVKVLESRLNQNSRNSSKPSSTDFGMKVLSSTFIFWACYSKNIMYVFCQRKTRSQESP